MIITGMTITRMIIRITIMTTTGNCQGSRGEGRSFYDATERFLDPFPSQHIRSVITIVLVIALTIALIITPTTILIFILIIIIKTLALRTITTSPIFEDSPPPPSFRRIFLRWLTP